MSDGLPEGVSDDEVDAFISHARWLLEYHDKRSIQLGARAVALLGFTGVIVSLLTRGVDLGPGLSPTLGLWITLIVTLISLLAAALFSLLAISTSEVAVPSATEAREMWTEYVSGVRRGRVLGDLAESFLDSGVPERENFGSSSQHWSEWQR